MTSIAISASRYAQRFYLGLSMNKTEITLINPLQLKPHPSNSKKHPKTQVEAIAGKKGAMNRAKNN